MVSQQAAANCFTEDHLHVPHHWSLVEKAQFFYTVVTRVCVCVCVCVRACVRACVLVFLHDITSVVDWALNIKLAILLLLFTVTQLLYVSDLSLIHI